MVNTQQAQIQLDELKLGVIGLFKNESGGAWKLVVEDNGDTIDIIYITHFGAIQETYGIPKHHGECILFPDGKNMHDMLDNPYEWVKFVEQFK